MAQPLAALRRRMRVVASSATELRKNVGLVLGGNPLITRTTFHDLLETLGVHASGDAVSHAFAELDINVHGTIDADEFCLAMFPATGTTSLQPTVGAQLQKAQQKRTVRSARRDAITDPNKLLQLLEHKVTRNVSGVASAYRHFRALARGNGTDIDEAGFAGAVKQLGIFATPACCAALFKKLDPNGNGTIDLNEFIKGVLHSAGGSRSSGNSGKANRRGGRGSGLGGSGGGGRGSARSSASRAQPRAPRREMMSKERMSTYIMQLRQKFMQHGGPGHTTMLNTWHKLRVFASARVPNIVTYTEFDKGLRAMGAPLPPKVVAAVFAAIDTNESGTIDFKEFVRYVFPQESGEAEEHSEDWQRLGAATLAARKSQRLAKTLGLIRAPAVLQATVQRKIRDSGKPAAAAFRRFRQAIDGERGTAAGANYVINCDDFKKALAHMTITATAACVETLFRHIDTDRSGAIDFTEFVTAIMDPEGKKADAKVRRALEQESFEAQAVSMQDIDGQAEATRRRMEEELQRRIAEARSDDVGNFMSIMRSRLGDATSSGLANRLDSHRSQRGATAADGSGGGSGGDGSVSGGTGYDILHISRNNNNNNNTAEDAGGLGVSGRGTGTAQRLPSINSKKAAYSRQLAQRKQLQRQRRQQAGGVDGSSRGRGAEGGKGPLGSKVSSKAAASSQRRAQRLALDRDPQGAFAVKQASLAPRYTKAPSPTTSGLGGLQGQGQQLQARQ